ncbi:MAG TPA: hypothetical protein VF557_09115 [Jatrophihabitans sp.]|jgi:hypothetical protein|uniref:hypothetical protein n=1 Tax=Jatrophihabitans sp. TaxID=1932789 RepID=UPI002EFDB09D
MIELLPPEPPAPPPARSGRGATKVIVAAVLALVVVVALINSQRNRDSAVGQLSDRQLTQAPSNQATPDGPGPRDRRPERLPLVACPQIRDEESRLGYRCIDNALQQDGSDTYLGLRITLNLEVEPGWLISQGSGNPRSLASPPSNDVVTFRQARQARETRRAAAPALPSADQVRAEVRRRTELALAEAYGDNPTSRSLAERPRSFGGVQGYQILTEITINQAYRERRGLSTRTERLWTVGLPTTAGVSIFMLSIPDNRSDLWAKAEATVATVHVL